jgi:hypothetical protein
MIKTLIAVAVAVTLVGCASPDYARYSDAQVKIAEANAMAARYKYEALLALGNSGGDVARVAAVMALQNQSSQSTTPSVQQPVNQGLQWASILVPSLTQLYSISSSTAVSVRQLDASQKAQSSQLQASTQSQSNQIQGFVEFGKLINSPVIVNPEIVTQPAPLIVTQPAPLIVTQPAPVIVNPVIVTPAAPVVVNPVIVTPPVIPSVTPTAS